MACGILIVEDEEVLAKNIKKFLERHGYDAIVAHTAADGLRMFDEADVDLVLLDINLPDMHGLKVLEELRRRSSTIPVICVTGHGAVQTAVDAMKAGAADFIIKPVALSELKLLIDNTFGRERLASAVSYYNSGSGAGQLLGHSPQVAQLRAQIEMIANAERDQVEGPPPPVLIRGETGTGKELIARALHLDGPRRDAPFIELNCAVLPPQLLESELFGHERGAFTDAKERKLGLVEAADGGTLFLDEIGDIELSVQTKLLKLLEDRTVRRVGGLRDRLVDVRFVSATNRPLEEWVQSGKFRSDLYYRLRVLIIEAPPLRAREGDARFLAEHFLDIFSRRYGRKPMRLSNGAIERIQKHTWPGNVRELKNTLEQAVLVARGDVVDETHLAIQPLPDATIAQMQATQYTAPANGAAPLASPKSLDEVERNLIQDALAQSEGNVTHAARLLGISRDTLRYRLEKHGFR